MKAHPLHSYPPVDATCAPTHGPSRPLAAAERVALLFGLSLCVASFSAQADTILGSKHDLSVMGPGPIRASAESEVCLFCHTPHRGTGELPLWNHTLSTASYTTYASSTTKATIGQPTGASKLCLSCHDGTVALGMVANRKTPIDMRNGVTTMPLGPSNLGTDLSDDHPVSFLYDKALVSANGELKDPSTLTYKVRLDHNNQMQCTSCHSPHDNKWGKFLVQDNQSSALCLNCHIPNYWQQAVHAVSPKTWSGVGINPWPHTTYTTVAANGCENCHAPHTAGTKARLLNFNDEERNCYSCHSGTVASKDLSTEFTKFSVHPILSTTGVHDPMEDPINPPRHVECVDCHNPHAAKVTTAVAPAASGALAGVKGVTSGGAVVNAVSSEYELCFRCHADSIARGPALITRQFVQTNTRFEFQSSNPSYHPVVAPGKNSNVPSLIAPWTTGSRIYCSDCHNNDQGPGAGGTGANGPHGSLYKPILERQYVTADYTPESATAYALCYKCHNRDSILADLSFHEHSKHVVGQRAPCSACHDAHGVEQQARLINFDRTITSPGSNGRYEFVSTGLYRGNCSVTCHGKDHAALGYGP